MNGVKGIFWRGRGFLFGVAQLLFQGVGLPLEGLPLDGLPLEGAEDGIAFSFFWRVWTAFSLTTK